MKIAILCPSFGEYGGIGRIAEALAERFEERGHPVALIHRPGARVPARLVAAARLQIAMPQVPRRARHLRRDRSRFGDGARPPPARPLPARACRGRPDAGDFHVCAVVAAGSPPRAAERHGPDDRAPRDFLNPSLAPANSEVFLNELPYIRALPLLPNWADNEEIAGEEIALAFYGQTSVVDAMLAATRRTGIYFGAEE